MLATAGQQKKVHVDCNKRLSEVFARKTNTINGQCSACQTVLNCLNNVGVNSTLLKTGYFIVCTVIFSHYSNRRGYVHVNFEHPSSSVWSNFWYMGMANLVWFWQTLLKCKKTNTGIETYFSTLILPVDLQKYLSVVL